MKLIKKNSKEKEEQLIPNMVEMDITNVTRLGENPKEYEITENSICIKSLKDFIDSLSSSAMKKYKNNYFSDESIQKIRSEIKTNKK